MGDLRPFVIWGLMMTSLPLAGCQNTSGDPAKQRTDVATGTLPASSIPNSQDDSSTSYKDGRAISGVDEAFSELDSRLFNLCGMATDEDECVVAHMVPAFDAKEGEDYCRSELTQGTFVDCIVNGKLLSQVAGNLGASGVAKETLWSDREQAWQQLNKIMYAAASKECQSSIQRVKAECINDFPLGFFGLNRMDVSACPDWPARGDCITGVAMGHLIREKLSVLF